MTLTDFILTKKSEEAARLLAYTDKSLIAISNYLGFSSQSHFASVSIDSFPVDKVHMAVPPAVPASVRAELFLFPPLGLDHRFAAVRAEAFGGWRRGDFNRRALDL